MQDQNAVLEELVRRYSDNRTDYRSGSLNETQTRIELIDPLLELLGWDVANKRGYADAYKSVVHEDHLTIEGRSKAPDYSFRVGPSRKFFLEAKRPAVNLLNDPEPAYQLRRYAWSAKLPLSVVTNFEHLAVYDCRFKPDRKDKASTARILLLGFEEYVARWQEIEDIFGFDAVHRGAFDRYATAKTPKKGTTPVDEAFLAEIERWRELLAKAIFRRNRELRSHQLNDSVQKTIDRIVFLRIAEDLGIETAGRLEALSKQKNVYGALAEYFREADSRYNSGLFHFNADDGDPTTLDDLTLNLHVDDKPLQEIIRNLYPPLSPYEFRIIPSDILGQIYERFLGRKISVSKGTFSIDEKPEVKKAGGVFYTPTYVVRYIVQASIAPLLEGNGVDTISGAKKGTPPLRVVDPSCGSGSFLIEVYQFLLDWYLTQYLEGDPEKFARGHRPRLMRDGTSWRLTIAERRRILLTHVYGVDIDPQAVEVTKLSLLLKVLEGETRDGIASQRHLYNERVLPDLDQNIKSGNSLIQDNFFGLFNHGQFTEEQLYKINTFTWHKEFKQVFADKGFSAVVGNPPYGALLLEEETGYLKRFYPQQNYQLDTYMLFVERALDTLLRQGGYLGMIIPNPWLTNVLQTKMRQFVLQSSTIKEVVHFTFPVFARAKAVVDTEIVVLQTPKSPSAPKAYIVSELGADGLIDTTKATTIEHQQDDWISSEGASINIFLNAAERQMARKIAAAGPPIGLSLNISVGMKPYQVGKGVPKQTRDDVTNRVFDSETALSAEYRQYLRGSDIGRYRVASENHRYIRYGRWLAEPRASARFDVCPKIVLRQTGDSLVAALDQNGLICMNNMHVLVPRGPEIDIYYLLGLLNSRLFNWYYQSLNPEMGEALAEVKKTNVERLPVPVSDNKGRRRVSDLAKAIEEGLREVGEAKDEHTRRSARRRLEAHIELLEQVVYDIFGLTPEERGLVETAQSEHKI